MNKITQKLKSFPALMKQIYGYVSDFLNKASGSRGKYSNVQLTSSVTYNYSTVNKINKKRAVYCFAGMVLLLILQESVFNDLRLFGVKPNLALAFLFLISSYLNAQKSMYIGLFLGLYADIIYGRYFGVYAFQFMFIAILTSVITPLRFKGSKIWQLITAFPIFFIYTLFEALTARFIHVIFGGGNIFLNSFSKLMTGNILPVVLYNYMAFLILLIPVFVLWNKLGGKEKVLYI